MHSCEVIRPFVRWLEGLGSCRRGILSRASHADFKRPFSGRRCMDAGVEVVHYAQRGHVHVPPVDGSCGAGLWLMDGGLVSPRLPQIPGAVP